MASDLPDLDQSSSFVVDDGVANGPMALGEIARSIAAGERPVDSYVWWEGEAEWVPFNSDVRLVMLLSSEHAASAEIAAEEVVVEEIAMDEVIVEEVADEIVVEDAMTVAFAEEASAEVFLAPVVIEVAEELAPVEVAPVEIVLAAEPEEVLLEQQLDIDEPLDLVALDEDIIDVRSPVAKVDDEVLEEIEVSQNSVLASVGARLEALASATRHAKNTAELDRAGASPVDSPVHAKSDQIDLRQDDEDDGVAEAFGDASEVRISTLETQFDSMVRDTVNHERLSEQSERIRELLARACAAAIGRQGYSVDRRSELHGHYYLGFECGVDTRRMRLEITPTSSVGGMSAQNAHIVMSWGRMAFDIEEALEVVQNQLPVADRRPGTISADAELDIGSVSTRVELVWAIDDFVGDDYSINREALELALASMQHALEKRWYELFIPAE